MVQACLACHGSSPHTSTRDRHLEDPNVLLAGAFSGKHDILLRVIIAYFLFVCYQFCVMMLMLGLSLHMPQSQGGAERLRCMAVRIMASLVASKLQTVCLNDCWLLICANCMTCRCADGGSPKKLCTTFSVPMLLSTRHLFTVCLRCASATGFLCFATTTRSTCFCWKYHSHQSCLFHYRVVTILCSKSFTCRCTHASSDTSHSAISELQHRCGTLTLSYTVFSNTLLNCLPNTLGKRYWA